MHDPNNLFRCAFVAIYAYPPQIKPVFYKAAFDISQRLKRANVFADTPFPRGISATFITAPEEETKIRRMKVDAGSERLWVSLRLNGDKLWDAADKDEMEPEVRRILDKIMNHVCTKYKLEGSII